VNLAHLRAFVWLRWRLSVNQFRKAGALNAALFFALVGLVLVAAVGLFVGGFAAGYLALPAATPTVRLLVWDGAVVAFLFFWAIGLLAELQRSEGLAIDKVLHLPVSPTGAFLIGYVSSLFSLTLLAFVPGMAGLILGQACAGSTAVLLALPLLAAFVLAVTAVTYQFQGWLATLMADPRRRRTVMVLMTTGFILLSQLPNLLNMTRAWDDKEEIGRLQARREQDRADWQAQKIAPAEYERRTREANELQAEQSRQTRERIDRTARLASTVLPPGWLALGAADLAGGAVGPALLGTLGLGAIGAASLWRAYRTTIRLYTGSFTGRGRRRPAAPAAPRDPNELRMLEWRLPRVSEPAAAVALAAFRSLMRAPEAKMVLVAPLMMLVMGGGAALSVPATVAVPSSVRPLLALGVGAMVMFLTGVQLVGNQFGFDRTGFRAFVLSPAPRREILLGKNLAVAPLAVGAGVLVTLVVGAVLPMRIDRYPAAVAQLVSGYLLFCLLANGLSILAPLQMAAGSMQPNKVRVIPALLQMVFLMVLPVVLVPILIPPGIEALLEEFGGVRWVPVSLVLSLLLLAATAFVYRRALTAEGNWLAEREQTILDVVTGK
jgi:hypothetical protein